MKRLTKQITEDIPTCEINFLKINMKYIYNFINFYFIYKY